MSLIHKIYRGIGSLKDFLNKVPVLRDTIALYDKWRLIDGTHRWVVHNVKQMAVELAKQQQNPEIRFAGNFHGCPRPIELKSGMCLQADMESVEYAYWLDQLGIPFFYHRKLWELAYVCQAVWQNGSLATGKRGLGFAVGAENLPSYFARQGVRVHATDAPANLSKGWAETNQYAATLESLYRPKLISREVFDKNVTFESVDMNRIPERLRDFDFCWSICSLEHLGSIQKGLDFILRSLGTLKSGGCAVHTTEYTISSNNKTIGHGPTVLYRRQDMERVVEKITREGHEVFPLDFHCGKLPLDHYIDLPPSENISPHLKLAFAGHACTSFGLIIRKK